MRVLVTRPEADARRTARRLEALGHECLAVPLTAVRTLAFDWPEGPIDAIVVTSAHAMSASGIANSVRNMPLFAVGERTAAAARAGAFTDVRIGGGDVTALLTTIDGTLRPPAALLYLAGLDRKPALEAGLAERGYTIATREVYEVAPVETLPMALAEALRRGRIDATLHFSRRSAAIFCRLVADAGVDAVAAGISHHCLSADVAEPLCALGARRVAIAEAPTEAALLATTTSAF